LPAISTVTGVSPNQGPSAGGTTVTITGTNFLNAIAVTFGGAPPAPSPVAPAPLPGGFPGPVPIPVPGTGNSAMFVVNSATKITAFSPAHAVGTVHVQVTGPDGTSTPTAADQFTYQ
jgi:hypothetical protein